MRDECSFRIAIKELNNFYGLMMPRSEMSQLPPEMTPSMYSRSRWNP